MQALFGPSASNLASSVLSAGLGDRMCSLGLSKLRLERAAGSFCAAESLSSRETAALAYMGGLSGREAALLALGELTSKISKPKFTQDRIERLAHAKTDWWTEPSSRVSDLGDDTTRRLLGALMGLDFRGMTGADPLSVPADARYAAMAKLSLGEHWELLVGLRDHAWIGELTASHELEARKILPQMTREDLEDQETDDEMYHLVPVPTVPLFSAARVFGHGVGMVISAAGKWALMFIHQRKESLSVTFSSLNERWMDSRDFYRDFPVRNLAEVGSELIRRVPQAVDWNVVALRFPTSSVRVAASQKKRFIA